MRTISIEYIYESTAYGPHCFMHTLYSDHYRHQHKSLWKCFNLIVKATANARDFVYSGRHWFTSQITTIQLFLSPPGSCHHSGILMKYRPFWCNIDHKFKNIDHLSKMVDYRPMVDNIDPVAALQKTSLNVIENFQHYSTNIQPI